jgi:hypothetical protein
LAAGVGGAEPALDQVRRPGRVLVRDRGAAGLAAHHAMPASSRMSLSTVQRATGMPSRFSVNHTFRAP